jgi:hypothetical protein
MLRISSETCILLLIFPLICYFLMCGILVLISYHICVVLISYIWVAWWIDDLEGLHILVAVPVSKIGRSNSAILCHVKLDKHEGWADSICQITCKHEGFRTYHFIGILNNPCTLVLVHSPFCWNFLLGVIIFGSVSKLVFFLNRNRTGTGSNEPVPVRFGLGILKQKPVWLGFFRFGSVQFFRFQA